MRRVALAGAVCAISAALGGVSADAAGVPARVAGAGGDRTGNLIALVRAPQVPAGIGRAKRDSLVGAARSRIAAVVQRSGLRAVDSIPDIGAVTVRPRAGESPLAASRELAAVPGVRKVEMERYRTLRYLPDDPALRRHDPRAPSDDFYEWNLRREGFRRAWTLSRGTRAKLAVIDTGVDGTHPDLSSRIVRAKGYDYPDCGGLLQPACTGPQHDEVGHGTHVAGLACGAGNNGFGIAGAAFACNLIVEKASDSESIPDGLIAASITDATDHGADVINMSFGGGGSSATLNRALDYAFARNVVLVAAASNVNTTDQGSPASHLQPNGTGQHLGSGEGLVVTAAGHNGRPAWFHPGHGSGISLAAYGAATRACASRSDCGIFSSFPGNETEIERGNLIAGDPGCGGCRSTFDGSSDFGYLEGTSMATPQVAGAAALIRSLHPRMKNTRVMRIIKRTASGDRFTPGLGWGILNAGRAVRRAAR